MAVDLRLSMKLGQQMVMTPQLQAAIKLLQMNRLELTDTIRNELLENPLLEEVEKTSEVDSKEVDDNSDKAKEVSPETDKNPDFDWENYLEQSFSYSGRGLGRNVFDAAQEEGAGFESVTSKKKTLEEHLLEQLNVSDFDGKEREVAGVIIASLDEWGYLTEPLETIARKCHADLDHCEFVLKMVQEFDPLGVAARDLKECLLLQVHHLKIRKSKKDILKELIENYLHHIERKNYKAVTKALDLEMDELNDYIHLLKHLEPRPGRPWVELNNPYVTPDIYIRKANGEFVINLNEDGMPKLKISQLYRSILKTMPEAMSVIEEVKKSETVEAELAILSQSPSNPPPSHENGTAMKPNNNPREYIQNKLRGALWLIRSIHQRHRTIYRVTESIIKNQKEFLEQGVAYLKPMVLKDVADDIGMHESTISRVTSNKYVHTPQGIFELKYFFSSGIQKINGEIIAAESIKEKIRNMIKSEDEKNPISDHGLVQALHKQGIDVARRTVAKYREVLGILPSSQRKALY